MMKKMSGFSRTDAAVAEVCSFACKYELWNPGGRRAMICATGTMIKMQAPKFRARVKRTRSLRVLASSHPQATAARQYTEPTSVEPKSAESGSKEKKRQARRAANAAPFQMLLKATEATAHTTAKP